MKLATSCKGKDAWNEMLADDSNNRRSHLLLTIVIGMCVFHTGNGIRVMLGHGGIGVGKPTRPDYPYDSSYHKMLQTQNWNLFIH